jgi:peptidoglycan/LPS O-acetylase OafA/YrhL
MPERINGGQALVAIGSIALLVSLFLSWYEPGRSAWTVFEVWDIVLAAISIAALAAIVPARRAGVRDEHIVPERWLPALAGAAVVVVVVSLINHPPAARGDSPEVGAWLALASTAVLGAGATLTRARVSLIITLRSQERSPAAAAPPAPAPVAEPEPREADFEAETATQTLPPTSRN